MHGSYIERVVEESVFEDFKMLSAPLSMGANSLKMDSEELDIDEGLMFEIYEQFYKNYSGANELKEADKFRSTLAEIVDALYSGPAVDYVILKK